MFCRSKIENNAKGNDILNIVMFLAAKKYAKGNDILDILLFSE